MRGVSKQSRRQDLTIHLCRILQATKRGIRFAVGKSTPRDPGTNPSKAVTPHDSGKWYDLFTRPPPGNAHLSFLLVVMILPQVHLRKPCYDFTFL